MLFLIPERKLLHLRLGELTRLLADAKLRLHVVQLQGSRHLQVLREVRAVRTANVARVRLNVLDGLGLPLQEVFPYVLRIRVRK